MEKKRKEQLRYKSAGDILADAINIKDGEMTFGQRIELGRIFGSQQSEAAKFEEVFQCLYGYIPQPAEYKLLLDYFGNIVDGIRHWIEAEGSMLYYEPDSEAIQADIRELAARIGKFGTIKALARVYAKDPDEILSWKYGKVFGILYTDLEEHKFQRTYQRIVERKNKFHP